MVTPKDSTSNRVHFATGLILISGLMATLLVFSAVRRSVLHDVMRDIQEEGASQVSSLSTYLNTRLLFLDDLARHVELSPKPDPQDFQAFVETERTRVRGIQALEWAPLVLQADRSAAEAQIRKGHPAFQGFTERAEDGSLQNARPRPRYFPVSFLEPLKGNEAALGYDLGSNPVRSAAIEAARDSGQPQTTEPITLVQETHRQAGFLIFVPVYAKGSPVATVEQRRQAFHGVVLGVFRIGDLATAALNGNQRKRLHGELNDVDSHWAEGPLYTWNGDPDATDREPASIAGRLLLSKIPTFQSKIEFAGRTWVANFQPNASFIPNHPHLWVWAILPVGLTLTGLLAILFQLFIRQREQALLAKESARYHSILNIAQDGIHLLDDQGRLVECNDAFLNSLGRKGEDPAALRVHDWDAQIPPERLEGAIQALMASPAAFETRHRRKDGSTFDVEVNAGGIVLDGKPHLLAASRDITERKRAERVLHESENSLRIAQHIAHVGSWTWNVKEDRLEWSDEMFHIFGIEKEGFHGVLSEVMAQAIHPDDRAAVAQSSLSVTQQGLPVPLEYRVIWPDGTVRVVWAEAGEITLDEAGNPAILTGIVQDLTERKQAEEEKARLQAQLQQSQKMESLGSLASGVAHDMNNVLGAILGLASAHIGSQPNGSPLHQALDTICKATERGGKMVKSLLSFARQTPAENDRLDMNAILKEQIRLLERTILAQVRLQMDLEAELRPIQGDAGALAHAFMNLCVNAVDAMPENGTLTLHTRNVDHDWIEVVVEDTGMGMPKEVLEKAMDPFFTTKGTGRGTGLGLPIVFSTVRAHKGQMTIQSEPGQGTRVSLRFPACEEEDPVAAPAAAEATLVPRRARTVLLVDDDELIRSSVQALLEVLGHTAVTSTHSGEEALALLEAGLEPDFVILDMNMPGLGGAGTLPHLRKLRPWLPVLLSTGRTDQTALALASAHPGVTLLSKPFGLRELQKHLESIGLE